MFMVKRIFEDVDEKTFQYIKRCKNENGLIDCHKLFRKINVGDTIIFSCKNNKIEACLKKVNIYKSLKEMLDTTRVKTIEYNGGNPFEFLEIINNKSQKRFRVYDVDYYEEKNDEDNNRPKRTVPKEISNMIESIVKKDNDNIWDDDDDDDWNDD
jgi:ASC-1-like (ASCH) protein